MDKLGFGLMRLPYTIENTPSSVNIPLLCEMVDRFLEAGFTYFDTAWMYNGFSSETAIKEALVKRHARDSFTLADKLHAAFVKSFEDRDLIFNKQLEKTGVEYFDYYLLHGIDSGNIDIYEKFDCFNWIMEKKEKGLIKHCGFSFHADAKLLDRVLEKYPWFEFVQLQINYLDWENPVIQSKECYETCVRHKKSVTVMEPIKGGALANVPEKVRDFLYKACPDRSPAAWALGFPCSLPNVRIVLSGMSEPEQVEKNIDTIKKMQPLTEDEIAVLREAARLMREGEDFIPCTGCAYCTPGCPMNIPIPKYFSLYNAEKVELRKKGWTPQKTYYANLTKTYGRAGDCSHCKQCEEMCPQHLSITAYMEKVSALMDKK